MLQLVHWIFSSLQYFYWCWFIALILLLLVHHIVSSLYFKSYCWFFALLILLFFRCIVSLVMLVHYVVGPVVGGLLHYWFIALMVILLLVCCVVSLFILVCRITSAIACSLYCWFPSIHMNLFIFIPLCCLSTTMFWWGTTPITIAFQVVNQWSFTLFYAFNY